MRVSTILLVFERGLNELLMIGTHEASEPSCALSIIDFCVLQARSIIENEIIP
ncbi:MAG: hypothetical protein FWE44_07435 [Defluviitaleaceae bacterium]|nr:hypothetical protein [Defluviitaleaceae bacterium]